MYDDACNMKKGWEDVRYIERTDGRTSCKNRIHLIRFLAHKLQYGFVRSEHDGCVGYHAHHVWHETTV